MSSYVFYKFKSQKEPSRITFDGPGISVWDLKKEILLENKMGRGIDFDFAIYNADSEEEYTDDRTIIPRSTSVIARRLPPSHPGRGNAQHYMLQTGTEIAAATQAKGQYWKGGKRSFAEVAPVVEETAPKAVQLPAAAASDEASALTAMFAAASQQWEQTQEQMQGATYRPAPRMVRPGGGGAPGPGGPGGPSGPGGMGGPPGPGGPGAGPGAAFNNKPPPQGYICYRCGQKGHWINMCPTNGNVQYDDRPRIKRTTGIPKSFLTTLEGEGFGQKDGKEEEDDGEPGAKKAKTVMVTADGGFVVARPDRATWFAHRAHTKHLTAADVFSTAPADAELSCGVCSRLLRKPVLTPCCATAFCRECLETYLEENDALCPECESRVRGVEKLQEDTERSKRVDAYVEKTLEENKKMNEEFEKEAKIEREAREREITKMAEAEGASSDAKALAAAIAAPAAAAAAAAASESKPAGPIQGGNTPTGPPGPGAGHVNNNGNGNAPPGSNGNNMNPQMAAMFAAQVMQLQMAARNSSLPQNVRMQAQMQLQQMQQMASMFQ